MPNDPGIQLWNDSAAAWIRGQGEHGDQSRQFLDPFVWEILGNVQGLTIADIGCGEGRFCRLLQARGAKPVGIEPTENLISVARQRDPEGDYRQEKAEKLSIASDSMDLVIFYLTMIDFDPIEPAIAEAMRILKPGGRCVVINLTSMNTASDTLWIHDENGKRVAWSVENYGRSHPSTVEWSGIRIINYHRPLSVYFQCFLAQGFQLENYLEPVPTDEQIQEHPEWAGHLIVPYFNIHVWDKPANV